MLKFSDKYAILKLIEVLNVSVMEREENYAQKKQTDDSILAGHHHGTY